MASKTFIAVLLIVGGGGVYSYLNMKPPAADVEAPLQTRVQAVKASNDFGLKWGRKKEITASAYSLFSYENFDALEAKASEFRSDLSRDDTGRTRLIGLYDGIEQRIREMTNTGHSHNLEAMLSKWKEKHPTSVAQRLAQIDYHVITGWNARGSGFADTVQQQAWETLNSELNKAYTQLSELQKQKDVNDPQVAVTRLSLYRAMGTDAKTQRDVALESIKASPTYEAYYETMAWNLLPRWGGTPESALEFANFIRKTLPAPEGDIGYFRFAMTTIKAEGFSETKFPWDDLNATARTIVAKYPAAEDVMVSMLHLAALRDDQMVGKEWGERVANLVDPLPVRIGREDRVTTSLVQQQVEWAKGETPNPFRPSPLEMALIQRDYSRLNQLLSSGTASTTRVLSNGQSPLHFAIEKRDTSAAALLLRHGANPYEIVYDDAIICLALRHDDVNMMRLLLPYFPDPKQSVSNDEYTLMMKAAFHKAVNCTRYLLYHTRYDLKLQKSRLTAPMVAAGRGSREIIEMYLARGFDINTPAHFDITILGQAGYEGHTELVKWLLEKGANPAQKNVSGYYPWHQAEFGGRPETMRVLREAADAWEAKHGKK